MGNLLTGGITNPLEVVEQMTYLMFIRSDDSDTLRAKSGHAGTALSDIFADEVKIGDRKVDDSQRKWMH